MGGGGLEGVEVVEEGLVGGGCAWVGWGLGVAVAAFGGVGGEVGEDAGGDPGAGVPFGDGGCDVGGVGAVGEEDGGFDGDGGADAGGGLGVEVGLGHFVGFDVDGLGAAAVGVARVITVIIACNSK